MNIYRSYITTPLGRLEIETNADEVTALTFTAPGDEKGQTTEQPEIIGRAKAQLAAYFAGTLKTFDLPMFWQGTPFQKKVWQALTKIPYGETTSYGAVAKTIGAPQAVRAVGSANGKNRIAIVVPCHRVIGKDGSLTGYGGGLDKKRWLLDHEKKNNR